MNWYWWVLFGVWTAGCIGAGMVWNAMSERLPPKRETVTTEAGEDKTEPRPPAV